MKRGNPDISQHAAAGGRAKAAKRKAALTLERVEATLGALDSLEDAQRWLRHIGLWAAAGLLAGSVTSACVRAVEVWIRSHEARLSERIVGDLRERLDELEAQLKRQSMGAAF